MPNSLLNLSLGTHLHWSHFLILHKFPPTSPQIWPLTYKQESIYSGQWTAHFWDVGGTPLSYSKEIQEVIGKMCRLHTDSTFAHFQMQYLIFWSLHSGIQRPYAIIFQHTEKSTLSNFIYTTTFCFIFPLFAGKQNSFQYGRKIFKLGEICELCR